MRTAEPEAAYLLDTSAIVALLDNEAGADRVEHLLRNERVLLPFLVSLETYYICLQEAGEEVANARYSMLKALPVEHLNEMDEPTLLTAGRFKARHRVSLADAMIAAYAFVRGAVLVHKDPELETLAEHVRQLTLPYKPSRRRN